MIELSVLIASHNRRERLRRCLDSLAAQTQSPSTFEVIVADDGSGDGTAEMAETYEAPFSLRVLRLEKAGKSAALNAAIEAAAGSACVFLDDDILATPGLLAAHLDAHRAEPKTLGVGRLEQRPPANGNWFGVAHAAAWNERYDALAHKQPDWPDTYGGNFSAPTATLREVGGFATDLPAIEDIELGYRLCEAGCVPRYLADADGVHDDEKPRARLLADTRRYGAFCAEFAERRPAARPRLLGWFLDTTPREVMLRRLLLTLRVPPSVIAPLGGAIPGAGRKRVWHGFVDRYAFWRGARSGMDRERWLQTTRGVPVLMYHGFTANGERDRYILPRRSFARQMRLLSLLRRNVIPFEELARALAEGQPLPRRAVVLTIDDGYRDNLEIAHPILRRHGFAATIFVVTRHLDGNNDWGDSGAVNARPMLSTEEVRRMAAEGTGFGAHTRSHPRLPELDPEGIAAEVAGSKQDLEGILSRPVETFAYPYGRFDERVVAAVGEAGFLGACTVEGGFARLDNQPPLVPRIEVCGGDGTVSFLRKLWFGGN